MKTYTHLFFDLDNTLWDFDKNSEITLSELYDAYSLDDIGIYNKQNFIENYKAINLVYWENYRKGKISKDLLREHRFIDTLKGFGIENIPLAIKLSSAFIEICPKKNGLIPNAIQILEILKRNYNLHIITNGFEDVQKIKLSHSGFQKYFNEIITSEKAGYSKPDPKIFEYALQKANANKNESLYIGDSLEVDMNGSRKSGIDHVFFNPSKKRHTHTVTYEISSLPELLDILKKPLQKGL